VFGSTLGLLVFIYYASRFVLFVTAWAATSPENQTPEQEPVAVPGPAVIRAEVVIAPRPGAGAAAGLFGAGAVVGLLGAVLVRPYCAQPPSNWPTARPVGQGGQPRGRADRHH
jgi:membrane protein